MFKLIESEMAHISFCRFCCVPDIILLMLVRMYTVLQFSFRLQCLFYIYKTLNFGLNGRSLQGHWWGFISRNYVVWPTFLLMNVFIALKGSHFWFLFEGSFKDVDTINILAWLRSNNQQVKYQPFLRCFVCRSNKWVISKCMEYFWFNL